MVSPIGGYNSPTVAAPMPPVPEDVFKKLDSGNKGYLTKDDLRSAIVSISDKGAQLSQSDAAAKVDEVFTKMDANKDGKVTADEFKASANNAPPPNAPRPGGTGGGHGGPKGGAGEAAGGTNNTSYALADANKDGVVTQLEQLAYNAKHLATGTLTTKATFAEALKAYQS